MYTYIKNACTCYNTYIDKQIYMHIPHITSSARKHLRPRLHRRPLRPRLHRQRLRRRLRHQRRVATWLANLATERKWRWIKNDDLRGWTSKNPSYFGVRLLTYSQLTNFRDTQLIFMKCLSLGRDVFPLLLSPSFGFTGDRGHQFLDLQMGLRKNYGTSKIQCFYHHSST